jgi:hypothetical protein
MKMPFWAPALTIIWYLLLVSIVSSEDPPARQLLMIGNSYTNRNDLFKMIQSMLEEAYGSASASPYTPSGKTLSSHLSDADSGDDTNTLRRLLVTEPKNWDWVTLQEQSQTAGFVDYPFLYSASLEGAIGLDAYVKATGGETVFFMTWGRRNGDSQNSALFPDFLTMNTKLVEGYQRYVEETSTAQRPTKLAPVGMAFEIIYRGLLELGLDPLESGSDFVSLYANDGSHPSVQGSYLAACVLYTTMTERDCRLVGYTPSQLTEETAIRLRDVAYKAVQENQLDNVPTLSPFLSFTESPTQNPIETPTISSTSRPTETPTCPPSTFPYLAPVIPPKKSLPDDLSKDESKLFNAEFELERGGLKRRLRRQRG